MNRPLPENVEANWASLSPNTLILGHASMVKYIAVRIFQRLPPSVELEDLYQAGTLGLIDAVSKFDPERGNKFGTYAEFRIRGAILDELRAMDWVPRSVRQSASRIEAAYAAIEGKHGRAAEDDEVARHMGLSLEQFYKQLEEANSVMVLCFDDIRPSIESSDTWNILEVLADPTVEDPIERIGLQEIRDALREAIDLLPERERLVMNLYYVESLTLLEIGEVLNLTESRISQMRSKAVLRIRARLHRKLHAPIRTRRL